MNDELTKDRFSLEVDSSDDDLATDLLSRDDLLKEDTSDEGMLSEGIRDSSEQENDLLTDQKTSDRSDKQATTDDLLQDTKNEDDDNWVEQVTIDSNLINDRLLNNDLIKEKLSKDRVKEDDEEISGKFKFKKKHADFSKNALKQEKKSSMFDWLRIHLTRENIVQNRFHIVQVVAVVLLAVFIGCLLYDNVPDNVSLSTIEEALENTDVFPGNMQEADSKRIRRLYGINKNDYLEILSYIPENSMDVDELLIVHVSDSSQIQTVKVAMEERLSSQKTSFDGYGTNQTELLGDADIESRGNYVYFAVGKDHKSWIKTIQEALH